MKYKKQKKTPVEKYRRFEKINPLIKKIVKLFKLEL